jgi:ATP-dependent helicase HrpB
MAVAMSLLKRLGAIDDGRITRAGRVLQRLPLHPRLGRVLIEAHGSFEGAAICAWLSEPARLEGTGATTSCDLLPILDRWHQAPSHLKRAANSLQQIVRPLLGDQYRERINEQQLRISLLAGYPDRVARRRPGPQKAQLAQNEIKLTLATGHGAALGRESGVHDAEWIVAIDVTSGRSTATTEALVRLASRIEPEWLTPTRSEVVEEFDAASGAVKARSVNWYDGVVLRERAIAPSDERRAELLARNWVADAGSIRLLKRLEFAGVQTDTHALVLQAAQSAKRSADVRLTEEALPWDIRQQLQRHAPDTLTVPSGRDMKIDYGDDGAVSVAVKLQELFGLAETPRIGRSQTPITFHLLAPNGRPVQTTQDLRSFWERTYPEVRKELRGRYPRHPWPDDPWKATPTHRTTRRR